MLGVVVCVCVHLLKNCELLSTKSKYGEYTILGRKCLKIAVTYIIIAKWYVSALCSNMNHICCVVFFFQSRRGFHRWFNQWTYDLYCASLCSKFNKFVWTILRWQQFLHLALKHKHTRTQSLQNNKQSHIFRLVYRYIRYIYNSCVQYTNRYCHLALACSQCHTIEITLEAQTCSKRERETKHGSGWGIGSCVPYNCQTHIARYGIIKYVIVSTK